MSNSWMVRADGGGPLFDLFKEKGLVAIGWAAIGSLEQLKTRDEIAKLVHQEWPSLKHQAVRMTAGQLFRFRHEIKIGDFVTSYNTSRRIYAIGEITSNYKYDTSFDELYPNIHSVNWMKEVSRDDLSLASRNTLGAVATLFTISDSVRRDLEGTLSQLTKRTETEVDIAETQEGEIFEHAESAQDKALEFIKDAMMSQIEWDDMQELVAGLLRALGYKTKVSPKGADRGKDIIASPDGFGLVAPRIVVEVKHRQGATGADQIRSFLGGRHRDDKGLYVSTGGFTKDAKYEADRASIPLTLMDMDELVRALLDNYEKLDLDTRQLLPLKRIYWPV